VRTLHDRIGGDAAIATVVDELYVRLTTDPRVQHHFHPERLDSLKAAQRRWFRAVLGGTADADDRPDIAAAHKHLVITDEQVDVVLGHLSAAIEGLGTDEEVRRQVMALVRRMWYAREF
jgi:hemoglobin